MSNELRTPQDDDGFHEIQLNGKQLVFLGMATTLVSVVIFLCGVLVGRGVRPLEPVAEAAAANLTADAPAVPGESHEPMAIQEEPEPAGESRPADEVPAPSDVPAAAEPPATAPQAAAPAPEPKEQAPAPAPAATPAPKRGEESRAAAQPAEAPAPAARETKREEPKATKEEPEPPPVVAEAPAPAPEPAARAAAPAGGKVAVQVAALSSRADAEAVARRLSGKGYAVYVVSPEPGAKAIFKVRVGNYASMDEAQRISTRLAQEEKLKPWIIR